jgi:ketosteroid isomerase-like protein
MEAAPTNNTDLDQLAERLFNAFVAHDLALVETMCVPDAMVTQNGDALNLPEALAKIAAMRSFLGDHQYIDVRRVVGVNAVVEEHRVISTTSTGQAVDLSACVVIRVNDDGLITALDEYVDVSAFA